MRALRAHLLGLVQRIRTMAPGRSTLLRNGSMASRPGSSTGESAMAGTRIASKSTGRGRRSGVRLSRIKKLKKKFGGREVGDDEDIYGTPPEPSYIRSGQGARTLLKGCLLCGCWWWVRPAGKKLSGWESFRPGWWKRGPGVGDWCRVAYGRGAL